MLNLIHTLQVHLELSRPLESTLMHRNPLHFSNQ